MKTFLIIATCILQSAVQLFGQIPAEEINTVNFSINTITEKGAWCWFADPRAIHYENESGTINRTYIGYIDVHGYIKATQIDHLNNSRSEVMIRSYFQPDDHNNPTFLVLPDERIMIFYSRHTDEPCFYYRISRNPGDITTLGKEMRLETADNTTYPSPFILSDDPDHIYLCWRGIGWHPTIARLTMPDRNDKVHFDHGPYQILQSQKGAKGVRPYAKYISNGKDKIYLTYTTTHPDNQSENWIYFNYVDINAKTLNDIKGNVLSTLGSTKLHEIDTTPAYKEKHPFAVVDDTPLRNWVWDIAIDNDGNPVIAMVSISEDKDSHDYYHVRWTGEEWRKTFLSNAGGHFHQSPDIEKCYSGGMTIDRNNPQIIYGSVPTRGKYGTIYELKKFTVDSNTGLVSEEQLTFNSQKNNSRPFAIASQDAALSLVWMQGDYYDWMVSSQRPQGFPTAIRTNMSLPEKEIDLAKGLQLQKNRGELSAKENKTLSTPEYNSFTLSLNLSLNTDVYCGKIIQFAGLTYQIPHNEKPKPELTDGERSYISQNVLGNSDVWKRKGRATNGLWYPPEKLQHLHLVFTYDQAVLRVYINGILDQSVNIEGLSLSDDIVVGEFNGVINNLAIYNRRLSQDEIKAMDQCCSRSHQPEML